MEALGFYQYAPPEHVPELKDEARATGSIVGYPYAARDYFADAEDVAEGGVRAFLGEIHIHPFLAMQGGRLETISEDFADSGYTITINGSVYPLGSREEFVAGDMGASCELTTTRTVAIVNTLLKQAGSQERVFELYGGHENYAVFLTNEMYEVLQQSGVLPHRELPIPMPGT